MPDELWQEIYSTIINIASEHIPYKKPETKRTWLLGRTIKIAEQRKVAKAAVKCEEARKLDADFHRAARKDSEVHWDEYCKQLEEGCMKGIANYAFTQTDAEPADERGKEKASEEEEILQYEQDITELLLTIAGLHGKIEHLQHQKARDDEDFSDLGSEYTASLPRCPQPFPNVVLALPPPARREEGHADLFLDVHKAMTSLENTILSHRSRISSTEAELEGSTRVPEICGALLMFFRRLCWAHPVSPYVCQSLEQSQQKFQGDDKGPQPQLRSEEESSAARLLPEEMSKYKREMALYEQRNAALRVALEGKDESLRRSKTTLCAYQDERDKLQRKVKELQDDLCKIKNLTDGFACPVQEGRPWGFQDPVAAAQNLIRCFQGASSTHPICHLFLQQDPQPMETHTIDMEAQIQQLNGHYTLHVCPPTFRFVEKLKCLNQLLSATLQECKSDSEGLSMLLGRRESDTTALRLAVQYSERCLEAYEVLWSLMAAQQRPRKESSEGGDVPVTAPGDLGSVCHEMKMAVMNEALRSWERCNVNNEGSGCADFKQSPPEPSGLEKDRKEVLQEYIRRLRAEQASLKLPASGTSPRTDFAAARINAGIVAKVAEVQRAWSDVLTPEAASPKMEKLHLVQELQTAREALADLNIQLHLTGKEKQGLELQTYTLKAQEAACLLIIRILQEDCEKSRGQQSGSSSSSSSSSSEDSDLRLMIGGGSRALCWAPGTAQSPLHMGGSSLVVCYCVVPMYRYDDTLHSRRESIPSRVAGSYLAAGRGSSSSAMMCPAQ
ncbi:harmonin-binding protein USHBP1-like [Heteronotia binoei]|uniref:harmonin-binding protein USHBP1-like n=1 Tax=Heteronotia binoei TaxID=13085 RepID=UPI00292D25AA|nr:harmonin-binding protein USHBP1-like [Heteronotia binoei]